MPFELTAEQRAIRQSVREFGEAEIAPVALEHEREAKFPFDIIEEAAEYGFVAPFVDEAWGGAGMDLLSSALVTEELWRADTGIGRPVAITGVAASAIQREGDEWMKEKWLPPVADGEAITALAITEPGGGSDVVGMETTADNEAAASTRSGAAADNEAAASTRSGAAAKRDGDEWVLNGEKTWITNGTVADVVVVFAKTDPDAGAKGISTFLVPADAPGLIREPIEGLMGHRAADLGTLRFEDCRVPAENIVGEPGEGFGHILDYLTPGRVDVAAQGVGAGAAALDAAIEYATEREQFGQPIADFQAVSHTLAEAATKLETARALTYRAAAAADAGSADAPLLANVAKVFATEAGTDIADDAIQVHGGAGYARESHVERYYRDVRVTQIYEGTNGILRNRIAADLL